MTHETSRREFLKTAAGGAAAIALASANNSLLLAAEPPQAPETEKYGIVMADLPYEENALEPWISAQTVKLHYFNHQRGYYNLLRAYIHAHPEYQQRTVEELIVDNQGAIAIGETMFDVSVLLFNHNHYWPSLKPAAGGIPKGKIGKMVDATFGSYQAFREKFIDAAMEIGIGWVWVVRDGAALKVYRSEYHDTPLLKGYQPLLAVDVWEHAYYLDYHDNRRKYVEAALDHLLNWEFAEAQLANAPAAK